MIMNRRTKIVLGTAAAAVIAGCAAAGAATAADLGGDDGPDVAISGADLERASEAALAETGSGEVVDSEVEENGYEVEVNLSDGRQIEVQLDADFAVVSSDMNEEGDDGDGG
jgi:uncharacterized membrane protein YkoI